MSTSFDTNLKNIHNTLFYDTYGNVALRTGFTGNIIISGNVNIPATINVASTPSNPVHSHITEVGTSDILDVPWLPIDGNVRATQSGIWYVNVNNLPSIQTVTGNVNATVTGGNINATINGGSINVTSGTITTITNVVNVNVLNTPGVTVTSGNINANITGGTITGITNTVNVNVLNSHAVTVTSGNVTATITDVITVITTEDAGDKYSFNNHAANTNRGWTMDDTMRPVVSFQNASANAADIIKIVEYEIGNNNANQSTIVYEWYEGPLTISGAAIPAWTTFGVHSQYRVYQDKYSSNAGNTFTVPAGTYMRHSGIIIGKNTQGDEGPANLHGGGSPNMLTLCMRRVDNSTKLDVWFAFTIRELT